MRPTLDQRFWSKVNKRGPRSKLGTRCWLWAAYVRPDGYGTIEVKTDSGFRPRLAHVVGFELHHGLPVAPGKQLDHLCRVRHCVRPDHLEEVTGAINTRRGETGQERGRQQKTKTHCPRGHKYEGGNLYVNPKGYRICRECMKGHRRKYRATVVVEP